MPTKNIGTTFSNNEEVVRSTYDFAVDGGAVAAFPIFTASSDIIITGIHAVVKTAATSGGSATVAVGITGSATLFVDATAGAVANLTLNAVLKPDSVTDIPSRLASGASVLMTVGTAALTAGKIEYVIRYMKA